jgi:hypothetical protein
MRQRLPPQPGGFEGFGGGPKGLDVTHAALIKLEELEERVLQRDAAHAADEYGAPPHENAVLADTLNVVNLHVPLVPGLEQPGRVPLLERFRFWRRARTPITVARHRGRLQTAGTIPRTEFRRQPEVAA